MSEVVRSSSSSLAKTRTKKQKASLKKKGNASIRLNWKLALNLSYSLDTIKSINRDRLWADFLKHFRELCPETTWFSLYTIGKNDLDPKLILKTHLWLETMVASSMWPFPPEVLIETNNKVDNSIRILIRNNYTALPFVETPDGIYSIKIRTQHYVGWEIRLEENLSQSKAGHV
ncbi:MAG: hypothetical protein WDA09_06510 [Bacteriovoracaceae bacterium]